ncbi:hypothetical protein ONE63_006530 [Megalurothrips usitatus]|uniref:Uncharacterized protein n=1 Tax=Megalurothrips usitatus TaxID=439358 RepID=A0AAV7XUA6_9NEOP|nr:hypothetical protein ONE63_006530 [Megalurothrips usitatus]
MWCRRNSGPPPSADPAEAMEVVDTHGNWRPACGPAAGRAVPRSPLPTRCQAIKSHHSPLLGRVAPGSPQPIRSQPVSLMSSPMLQRANPPGPPGLSLASPMNSPLPLRHPRGCQSATNSPLPLRRVRQGAAHAPGSGPASATASPARSVRSMASAASSRGASDLDLSDLGDLTDCSEAADLSAGAAAGEGVAENIVDGWCKFRDNKRVSTTAPEFFIPGHPGRGGTYEITCEGANSSSPELPGGTPGILNVSFRVAGRRARFVRGITAAVAPRGAAGAAPTAPQGRGPRTPPDPRTPGPRRAVKKAAL